MIGATKVRTKETDMGEMGNKYMNAGCQGRLEAGARGSEAEYI
jgi:hypothetical protein